MALEHSPAGSTYLRVVLVDCFVAGASALGRPVLMEGTACSAERNAASDSPASIFNPARSNSLFLTGWASAFARCFRASITAYSSLGMVKLSRTSLGFLARTSLAGSAGAGAAAFALAGAVSAGRLEGFFAGALTTVLVSCTTAFFTLEAAGAGCVPAVVVLAAGWAVVEAAFWLGVGLDVVMVNG